MRDHFDVIIVGAGIFGLATAAELAQRGHVVAAIDRFGSGHAATSSTGRSRGIRIAYDHPFYVSLAQEAIRRWKELEHASGKKILHLSGQVDFGQARKLSNIAGAVRSMGGVIEELDTAGLRRRLPYLRPMKDEHGLFHADAGTVLADDAMAALKAKVVSLGVMLIEPEKVIGIETSETVKVRTPVRSLRAETVVIAAGPWSGALLEFTRDRGSACSCHCASDFCRSA